MTSEKNRAKEETLTGIQEMSKQKEVRKTTKKTLKVSVIGDIMHVDQTDVTINVEDDPFTSLDKTDKVLDQMKLLEEEKRKLEEDECQEEEAKFKLIEDELRQKEEERKKIEEIQKEKERKDKEDERIRAEIEKKKEEVEDKIAQEVATKKVDDARLLAHQYPSLTSLEMMMINQA